MCIFDRISMKKIHCIISLWLFLILLSASSCVESPTAAPDVFFSFFAREYAAMAGGRPLDIAYTYADSSGFIESYTARDDRILSLNHTVTDTRDIFSSLLKLAANIPETFTRRGDNPGTVSEFYPAHLDFFIISNTTVILAWSEEATNVNPDIIRCIKKCTSLALPVTNTAFTSKTVALRADLLDTKTSSEFLKADLFIQNIDVSVYQALSNAVCTPFKLKLLPDAQSKPLFPNRTNITIGRDTLEFIYHTHSFQARTWKLDTAGIP